MIDQYVNICDSQKRFLFCCSFSGDEKMNTLLINKEFSASTFHDYINNVRDTVRERKILLTLEFSSYIKDFYE